MALDLTMHSAQTLAALMAAINGLILLVLWRAIPEEKASVFWAVAALFSAMRWFIASAATDSELAAYAVDASIAIGSASLVIGSLLLIRSHWPLRAVILVCAAAFAWAMFAREAGWSDLHEASLSILSVGALLVSGGAFIAAWRKEGLLHYAVLAGLLLVWAAIWAAGPFVAADSIAALALVYVRPVLHFAAMITLVLAVQHRRTTRLHHEIEERSRAEALAKASQRRFEDLVETSSDWVWELDKDLRFTFVSPNVAQITGYSAESYIGRVREELYDSAYADENWRTLRRLLEQRQPFRQIYLRTFNAQLGKPVTYAISGKPIFDAAANFAGYRGVGRDMTTQVATQAALDAVLGGVGSAVGTDYLRALVAHLAKTLDADVAFVAEVDSMRTTMRTLALWVDGGHAENIEHGLAGTPFSEPLARDLFVEGEGLAARFRDDVVLQAMQIEGMIGMPLTGSSGTPIGIMTLLKRSRIENADLAETVLKALAPRAAAELERQIADRKLRESERRFRDVLDHLPVAVHIKVGDQFQFVNRTFAKFVGIPVAELEGTSSAELHARMGWQDDLRPDALAVQAEVRRAGRVMMRERTVKFADGRLHDIVVATFPITNASGDVVAIGAAATDLTDMRRMESSLAQAQKMDALGRLAGGIAHDFNNIVGAIAGFARFILEDAPRDSTTQRHAERILTASSRAQKLVQQILTFSRRRDMPRQRVPIAGLLDEVVDLLRATLPRSTRFEVEAPFPAAALEADPTQITQVLVNICVNANDALNEGPGRIAFAAAEAAGADVAARIEQQAEIAERPDGALRLVIGKIDRKRRYVSLQVADTGHGMDRAVLERIFDPFFTTKAQGQGTGLGLPVVHGIVLDHGGALAITTRAGEGTTFEVWFPVVAAPQDSQSGADEAAAPSGRGRIMVVDDDDDFADMIATALERLGYEVAVVNHPAEAVAVFEDDPMVWDLVVTDHTMPDMTGLDLIGRIRKNRHDMATILCTGGHTTTAASALSAGASAYLTKPVDLSELGQAVARLIRKPKAA